MSEGWFIDHNILLRLEHLIIYDQMILYECSTVYESDLKLIFLQNYLRVAAMFIRSSRGSHVY